MDRLPNFSIYPNLTFLVSKRGAVALCRDAGNINENFKIPEVGDRTQARLRDIRKIISEMKAKLEGTQFEYTQQVTP